MEDDTIKRFNLTIVIDSFTGAVVGQLTNTINSNDQVVKSYAIIEKMGMPELMKTDNGKDYASKHYKRVLSDNGILQILCAVGQGRQKGKVERFFNTIHSYCSFIPGYIGNDVASRILIEDKVASKIDVRTGKATRIDPNSILPYQNLSTVIDNIINERYSNNYEDFEEFRLSDEKLLDIRKTFGKSHERKLSASGINIDGELYQSAEIWLNGLNMGMEVVALENIDNKDEIFVYHKDKYIGVAKNSKLGLDAMNQEEYYEAKKAHHKNHIAPFMKETKKDKKDYEQYGIDKTAHYLGKEDVFAVDTDVRKLNINKEPIFKQKEVTTTKPSNNKHTNETINMLDELIELSS